jgi:hypothetical protein
MQPFTFSELRPLLEYLDGHAATPQSIYSIQFWSPLQDNESLDNSGSYMSKMNVKGSRSIQRISERPGVKIEQILWRNRDAVVTLNCAQRELLIQTDVISFVEICRHKLTGQNVGKILVDLKAR